MFLFFFFSQHTYITILIKFSGAFTCLCFPPSSRIRSFKGTYHSSPGSFLGLSDFQSSRKSCLCWKVLYFTSKLFSSGQTSWLNKWVLSKVIFCLPPFVNCVFLRWIDECGGEGRLESNQGIHVLMFAGLWGVFKASQTALKGQKWSKRQVFLVPTKNSWSTRYFQLFHLFHGWKHKCPIQAHTKMALEWSKHKKMSWNY